MTDVLPLKGHQRKYLRGLAHSLKPIVFIGQKGASQTVVNALDQALNQHELVKVKFIEGKEKESKQDKAAGLESATGAHLVGHIGHTAIFYRPHPDEKKRKIVLPLDGTSTPSIKPGKK
jgi:RNA-binding protein